MPLRNLVSFIQNRFIPVTSITGISNGPCRDGRKCILVSGMTKCWDPINCGQIWRVPSHPDAGLPSPAPAPAAGLSLSCFPTSLAGVCSCTRPCRWQLWRNPPGDYDQRVGVEGLECVDLLSFALRFISYDRTHTAAPHPPSTGSNCCDLHDIVRFSRPRLAASCLICILHACTAF